MKEFIYRIEEDDFGDKIKTLIYEKYYDDKDRIIYTKDYQSEPILENTFEYDKRNNLTVETEIEDGVEVFRSEIQYNENDQAIKILSYLSGELFQETLNTYKGKDMTSISYQYGEETERKEIRYEGKNFTTVYFENGDPIQREASEFNDDEKSLTTRLYDKEMEFLGSNKEYGEGNKTFKQEVFNNLEELISDTVWEYDNDKLTAVTYRDGDHDYRAFYEYNDNGNVVVKNVEAPHQHNSYHELIYDDKNRLIEEKGLGDAFYVDGPDDDVYNGFAFGVKSAVFRFIHEYED